MKLYNYVRIQFALMQRLQQRLVNANWNMTSEECNNHAYFTYEIIGYYFKPIISQGNQYDII